MIFNAISICWICLFMEVTKPPSRLFSDEKTASIFDRWWYFFNHSFLFWLYLLIISVKGFSCLLLPVVVILGWMKGVPPFITITQQLFTDRYPLSAYTFPIPHSGSRSVSNCVTSWVRVLVKWKFTMDLCSISIAAWSFTYSWEVYLCLFCSQVSL